MIHNISLARLSTFAIGGRASNYVPVNKLKDLILILNYFHQENIPFKIFSGGSNVVFPDNGISQFLIHIKDGVHELENKIITADAGVPLARVISTAINNSLRGLENLSGIPGSIGGAVVGNAGAYGSSVSQVVREVKVWSDGKTTWLKNDDCRFSYRESLFKKNKFVVLKVKLEFTPSVKKKLQEINVLIIKKRKIKYKKEIKCPGSFFKNIIAGDIPEKVLKKIDPQKIIHGKIPTGYLLDTVGARGMSIGGIKISPDHGNLFINKGKGKAQDVRKLAEILKNKIIKTYGIKLEEEIRYL